jgi:hypothetical protein
VRHELSFACITIEHSHAAIVGNKATARIITRARDDDQSRALSLHDDRSKSTVVFVRRNLYDRHQCVLQGSNTFLAQGAGVRG